MTFLVYLAAIHHCTKNEVFHYGFLQQMWPNPHIFIAEILNGKLHFLCSAFVQGLHWTDNFWQQLLIKKSYFFGRQILGIWFFLRPVYLFHYSNCSHPSLEVVYLFLSPKEWESPIFWRVLYLFWYKNLQSSIAWVFLPAVLCLFLQKLVPAMRSYKGTIIIYIE